MGDTSDFEARMQDRLAQYDEAARQTSYAEKILSDQAAEDDRATQTELLHAVSLLQERKIPSDVDLCRTVATGRTYTQKDRSRNRQRNEVALPLKEHRLVGQAWILSRTDDVDSESYPHCHVTFLSQSGMIIANMLSGFEDHFARRLLKAPSENDRGLWGSLFGMPIEQETIPAPHNRCLVDPREYLPRGGLGNFYDLLANRVASRPYIHECTR